MTYNEYDNYLMSSAPLTMEQHHHIHDFPEYIHSASDVIRLPREVTDILREARISNDIVRKLEWEIKRLNERVYRLEKAWDD